MNDSVTHPFPHTTHPPSHPSPPRPLIFCCSCDVRLPVEPLEVRLTFCGNAESEMALVLLLDVRGQLGVRREVVLRDWGQEVRKGRCGAVR